MNRRLPRRRCMNCGLEVNRPEKIYCSNLCQSEYAYRTFIERWKSGLVSGNNSYQMPSHYVKRYIREKFKERCCVCGWGEAHPITGRIMVELHHIDGNHLNTVEENLILLCPNHHSLTPSFKSLNKGRGRKWRRLRQ